MSIEYAKQLMKINMPSTITIKQLAFMCGFEDPYYFSRVFKNSTGLSPVHYMKNMQL